MTWQIEFKDSARKELKKLSHNAQEQIIDYLKNKIASADDPRLFGKPLRSNLRGLWRFRVRDYRIICHIDAGKLKVLVVSLGHRKDIYE